MNKNIKNFVMMLVLLPIIFLLSGCNDGVVNLDGKSFNYRQCAVTVSWDKDVTDTQKGEALHKVNHNVSLEYSNYVQEDFITRITNIENSIMQNQTVTFEDGLMNYKSSNKFAYKIIDGYVYRSTLLDTNAGKLQFEQGVNDGVIIELAWQEEKLYAICIKDLTIQIGEESLVIGSYSIKYYYEMVIE